MILAGLLGLGGGALAGLFGVGGGILFVPALTIAVGLTQVRAEATSLLAIIPVAAVGAWRQHGYGNVDVRAGAIVGALSALGASAGVALANALPEHDLKIAFAVLAVGVAAQLVRRSVASLRERRGP